MKVLLAYFFLSLALFVTPNHGQEASQYIQRAERGPHFLAINEGPAIARITVSDDVDSSADNGNWPVEVIFNSQQEGNIVMMAFDCADQLIYYSVDQVGVFRVGIDGDRAQKVISYVGGLISGLSVDWVNRNLYWTDSTSNRIMVKNLTAPMKTSSQQVLAVEKTPRGIFAMLNRKILAWCSKTTIEISRMDGQGHQILYADDSSDMFTTLAILDNKMVFWDAVKDQAYVSSVVIDDVTKGTWNSFMNGFSDNSSTAYGLTEIDQIIYWRTIDNDPPFTAKVWYEGHVSEGAPKLIHTTTAGGYNNKGLIGAPAECPLLEMTVSP